MSRYENSLEGATPPSPLSNCNPQPVSLQAIGDSIIDIHITGVGHEYTMRSSFSSYLDSTIQLLSFRHPFRTLPKRSSGILASSSFATRYVLHQTFVDIRFAIHSLEASPIAAASIAANQIRTYATVLTRFRSTLIDVRLTEHPTVTQTALTHRWAVRQQTKTAVLTRPNLAKRHIAQGTLQPRSTRTGEIIAGRRIEPVRAQRSISTRCILAGDQPQEIALRTRKLFRAFA